MDLALEATDKLGELDIGQAAVAVGGRVVALEGAEGTDAMLERCAVLRSNGRIRSKGAAGVLVKAASRARTSGWIYRLLAPEPLNWHLLRVLKALPSKPVAP